MRGGVYCVYERDEDGLGVVYFVWCVWLECGGVCEDVDFYFEVYVMKGGVEVVEVGEDKEVWVLFILYLFIVERGWDCWWDGCEYYVFFWWWSVIVCGVWVWLVIWWVWGVCG